MPINNRPLILDNISVHFWEITETRDELKNLCLSVGIDTSYIDNIQSQQRACEKMATRLLINQVLNHNYDLCHTEDGAPYLKNFTRHISISHSSHIVGIAFADTPIGIDIEHKAEQVIRVRKKFLNERELATIDSNDKTSNLKLWTAKEAVYKVHGVRGIDFKNKIYQDIHINSVFKAAIGKKTILYKVQHFILDSGFMIAIATPKTKNQKNSI